MALIHTIHRVPRRIHVCILTVLFYAYSRSLCQTILFLIFGRSQFFIDTLGFFALGLESTLPIPQLIRHGAYLSVFHHQVTNVTSSNWKQHSLYGFRMSTLVGWFGGDAFKQVWQSYASCHSFPSERRIFSSNTRPSNSRSAQSSSSLLMLVSTWLRSLFSAYPLPQPS